jgi:hypothetical protein
MPALSSATTFSQQIGYFRSGGGGIRILDTPLRGIPGETFEAVPQCPSLSPLCCFFKRDWCILHPVL